MIAKCDIVNCKHNSHFMCNADIIEIQPNHISDTNGVDYHECIECATYEQQQLKKLSPYEEWFKDQD